jgi:antitoxin component YwqK of YwqJK toxin-antitoxin module
MLKFSLERAYLPFALFLGVLLLTACSTEIPQTEVCERGGLVFEIGAKEPFSGIVVGRGRESYHKRRLKFERAYINGLQEGATKYWYDDGQLESVIPFKKGRVEGIVLRYYPSGKKRSKVHYVNGLRGGKAGEMFWNPDGHLRRS